MKIESVTAKLPNGDYKVLYIGDNRSEARRVYKENMIKKDEFLALFQQSGYASRTMSKQGFIAHNETKMTAKPATKKKRAKKSED